MDLFANVGNTQKSMDYNMLKNDEAHNQTKKLEDTQNTSKDKQDDEIKKEEKKLTKDKLQDLTTKLNKEMEPLNPDIKFQYDDKVNELVVNVIDKNTDKVIRKIPSEEALKIMEKMRELVGALFDDKG